MRYLIAPLTGLLLGTATFMAAAAQPAADAPKTRVAPSPDPAPSDATHCPPATQAAHPGHPANRAPHNATKARAAHAAHPHRGHKRLPGRTKLAPCR